MTNPNTATMHAISQDTHGSPEVLKEVLVPRPVPGLSEVLVAVRAAGVNRTDWRNRAQAFTIDRLPLVLGWDVSGVVEAVGIGVTLFKPGDEVFGMLPYPHGAGSHAEYVTAPARSFARKPAGIDHVQAGALPLAALTAYQALVETAGVRPGQRKVREYGVRILRVQPAAVNTPFDANMLQADTLLPVYEHRRRVFEGIMTEMMRGGDDPAIVAKAIAAAATDAKPKPRYLVGSTAGRVAVLRRVVPARTFDKSIRRLNRMTG